MPYEMRGVPSLLYFLPLPPCSALQKVAWAAEVVKLGAAVLWVDMDISLFANPMRFLLEKAPDADIVLNSEVTNRTHTVHPLAYPRTSPIHHLSGSANWLLAGCLLSLIVTGRLLLFPPCRSGEPSTRLMGTCVSSPRPPALTACARARMGNGCCRRHRGLAARRGSTEACG